MERVSVVIDKAEPSCEALRGYMAEVFAALDERPRKLLLTIDVRNDAGKRFTVDYQAGEPVFKAEGQKDAKASFRGRYLCEHRVPLDLPVAGKARFVLVPTGGNRVKVRQANFFERIFG